VVHRRLSQHGREDVEIESARECESVCERERVTMAASSKSRSMSPCTCGHHSKLVSCIVKLSLGIVNLIRP